MIDKEEEHRGLNFSNHRKHKIKGTHKHILISTNLKNYKYIYKTFPDFQEINGQSILSSIFDYVAKELNFDTFNANIQENLIEKEIKKAGFIPEEGLDKYMEMNV